MNVSYTRIYSSPANVWEWWKTKNRILVRTKNVIELNNVSIVVAFRKNVRDLFGKLKHTYTGRINCNFPEDCNLLNLILLVSSFYKIYKYRLYSLILIFDYYFLLVICTLYISIEYILQLECLLDNLLVISLICFFSRRILSMYHFDYLQT